MVNKLLMCQYANLPTGCAVFRMAQPVGKLAYYQVGKLLL
jgi:hypothetical protein